MGFQVVARNKKLVAEYFNKKGAITGSCIICGELSVVGVESNINTNRCIYTFRYDQTSRTYDFKGTSENIEVRTFEKFLLSNGIAISANYVMAVREYLINEIHTLEYAKKTTYVHEGLGWNKGFGNRAFFCKEAINASIQSNLTGPMEHEYGSNGSREDYMKVLQSEVIGNRNLEFALTLGFAGPIISLLADYTSLPVVMVDMAGKSSSGKSTSLTLIASVWGKGEISNSSTIKTFNNTKNALMGELSGMQGMPVMFDDHESEQTDKELSKKQFTSLIYSISQGGDKGRCDSDGNVKHLAKDFSTIVVTTGEVCILDKAGTNLGLQPRVLRFEDVPWTSSKENAEKISSCAKKNYGFLGPEFIKVLNNYSDEVLEQMYDSKRKILLDCLGNIKNSLIERQSKAYALILITATIVKAHLIPELNIEEMGKLFADRLVEFAEEANPEVSAYDDVMEFVATQANHFYEDGSPRPSCTIYGKFTYDKTQKDLAKREPLVAIVPEHVEKILSKYNEKKRILDKWYDLGVIIHEKPDPKTGKRHFGKKVSLGLEQRRTYCYVFKRKFLFENEDQSVVECEEPFFCDTLSPWTYEEKKGDVAYNCSLLEGLNDCKQYTATAIRYATGSNYQLEVSQIEQSQDIPSDEFDEKPVKRVIIDNSPAPAEELTDYDEDPDIIWDDETDEIEVVNHDTKQD